MSYFHGWLLLRSEVLALDSQGICSRVIPPTAARMLAAPWRGSYFVNRTLELAPAAKGERPNRAQTAYQD